MHGSVNEERKITEDVTCNGNERDLDKCRILYTSPLNDECQLKSSVISVNCIHDSFAECEGAYEVPWGGKCYSLIPKRSTFEAGQNFCKGKGKKLVEITTHQENDLLSELLLKHIHSGGKFSQVWMGGKATQTLRRSNRFYWDGNRTNIGITLELNSTLSKLRSFN